MTENYIDLFIEWNEIRENTGEIIFAGLNPAEKKIVFNERRKNHIDETGGLYNTVLAHEIGHWILHVDAGDLGLQYMLPNSGIEPKFVFRSTGPNKPIEWQAHRFMSYLLMPHKLLGHYIETEDLCDWSTLYYLKEKFDVTISALVMRLKNMGLIFIDDDKKIYPSESVSKGQIKLI
jgi:Zn-dependent peptidase ImmA (M78 family)